MDGGAGSTDEGGAGSAVVVGGAGVTTGGTASGTGGSDTGGSDTGGSDTGGSDTGGSDSGGSDTGAGGAPGLCVPDALCSCEGFQGHDYRFCSVPAIRDAGLIACQSANMVLIRVDSAEENAWLLQQFIDHGMFIGSGSPIVILGGSDLQTEGMWLWDDGTLFWDGGPVGGLYTNFAGAPRNGQGDCLGMMSDGRWDGRACNSGNATVACESP